MDITNKRSENTNERLKCPKIESRDKPQIAEFSTKDFPVFFSLQEIYKPITNGKL
jgi:hypothetical protein